MDASAQIVRPPLQQRSRAAWERVLQVGVRLLESGGIEAVTVAEVCRLARVSPPSLYARVDGRAGLIAAIYEHAMIDIRAAEDDALCPLEADHLPVAARIPRATAAMAESFRRSRRRLRPIIAASTQDEWIHRRGVEEALRVQERVVRILGLPDETGRDIAAMLFAELVMHTVYGGDFSALTPEGEPELVTRLTRMALARAGADHPPDDTGDPHVR